MRSAMNAILFLLRTGCPRRYLPRDGFPPRSTVYNIFRKFQADGTWHAIWDRLHPMLRDREDREGSEVGITPISWLLLTLRGQP